MAKKELLIKTMILSSDARIENNGKEFGDPTEVALIAYGMKHGIFKDELENIEKKNR